MASLFNQQISATYQGLIKLEDNGPIDGTFKVITDGLGTALPVEVSTAALRLRTGKDFNGLLGEVFVATPTVVQHAANKGYVDSQVSTINTDISDLQAQITANDGDIAANATAIGNEETARINADNALLALINTNTNDIGTNESDISDLQNGVGNVISVAKLGSAGIAGAVTLEGGTNVTLTQSGQNIKIDATGGGGGAVDDVNGLTGAIDIVSTDADLLTVSVNGQDIELNPILPRTMLEDVKNVSGGALTKGMALHITGSTGNEAEVIKADAASGLAAHLILNEDLPNNLDTGKGVAVGFINNVSVSDTTNFQAGTEVYLGNAGAFTHVKPTGTSIVQYLGVILNASTPSGAGTVSGIIQNLGVENQLPNLQQDYVWVGDANGVPQAVSASTIGTTTTINNNANNRIITGSDTADTLEAESKFTYDGTNVDIIGAGVTDGLRITGGNIGGAAPSLGLISGSNFNRIDVKTDLVLQNQAKIAFDSDPTNTYIAADAVTPENIQFHADGDLQFYPDNAFEVYTVAVGATKVFNVDSGISNARVSIGYPAVSGPRELSVDGGITFQEDFFDYADTQSALTWKGETINLGSVVSTTAGRLYYYTGTTWALADADVLAAASSLLAIATATSSNKGMLVNGWYTIQGGATNGQLYMSPSAGLFTNTQPSTSGQYVRVVGHGLAGGLIRFNPSNDFYEVE